MRVLVVFCHPARESFCGSILTAVLEELSARGHETEVLDLYAKNFDPVLPRAEWDCYETLVSPEIQRYADQISRSDGLIWIFPTWNYGMPAVLKGYIDRVWKPGIAFRLDRTRNVHFDSFKNLKFFIVATTYGASWLVNTFVGNPCKKVVANGLRRHFSSSSTFGWLALYGMDKPSPLRLQRFLEKVRRRVRACAVDRISP
jgi:NAD(P)H dehydrogenase (quinone)